MNVFLPDVSGTQINVGSFNLMFVDSPEMALIVDDDAIKKDSGDTLTVGRRELRRVFIGKFISNISIRK